jgi:hypothetical protein
MLAVILGGRAVMAGKMLRRAVAVKGGGRVLPGRRGARNAPAASNGLQGERKRKKQNAQGCGTHRATSLQDDQKLTETGASGKTGRARGRAKR